jgi:hypothetical protein
MPADPLAVPSIRRQRKRSLAALKQASKDKHVTGATIEPDQLTSMFGKAGRVGSVLTRRRGVVRSPILPFSDHVLIRC